MHENMAVMVHGIAGPATSLDPLRAQARTQRLRSLAPTISGHGHVPVSRTFLHTTDAMDGVQDIAAQIEYVRSSLHARNITLGGFSMGAFYTLLYLSLQESGKVPPVDRAVFLAPAPVGLQPSLDVFKSHPLSYLSGVARLRIDKILRSSHEMFMGEDVPAEEQKKYFDALRPVSIRAYLQFMFPSLLVKGFPKPHSLQTPATILRAKHDRVCSKKLVESVATFFKHEVPIEEIDSSHCGILHSKEAADALSGIALGRASV